MITLRPIPKDIFTEGRDIPALLYDERGGIIRKVEAFLVNRLAAGMANNTLRAYAYDLLSFYRFLGSTDSSLGNLSLGSGVRFVLALREGDAAPRTINRRIAVIKSFLNFCKDGLGDRVFATQVHSFYKGRRNKALLGKTWIRGTKKKSLSVKVPHGIITPLSADEIRQFVEGIRTYRNMAIICLMLFCGLRTCEVLSLTTGDIDFADTRLLIRGKGGKERVLPMSLSVNKTLSNYLSYERPETSHNRCFVTLKGYSRGRPMTQEGVRMIFRHRRKNALKRVHPHLLRHSFCTNLIVQGVSLPVVQKLMGHNDIEVTLNYVHMSISDVAKEYHIAMNSLEKYYETKTI